MTVILYLWICAETAVGAMPPYLLIQLSAVYRGLKKKWKIKEIIGS
jgi:hypothetical protein